MIQDIILARSYAKAIFDIALEENNFSYWKDELDFLAKLTSNNQIKKIISIYRFHHEKLIEIFIKIYEDQISIFENKIIKLIIKNNCLHIMKEIYKQFSLMEQKYNKYLLVDIISVHNLKKDQLSKIIFFIKNRFHYKVKFTLKIDKSIIGGIIIRVNDMIIDNSIRGRLNYLTQFLKI